MPTRRELVNAITVIEPDNKCRESWPKGRLEEELAAVHQRAEVQAAADRRRAHAKALEEVVGIEMWPGNKTAKDPGFRFFERVGWDIANAMSRIMRPIEDLMNIKAALERLDRIEKLVEEGVTLADGTPITEADVKDARQELRHTIVLARVPSLEVSDDVIRFSDAQRKLNQAEFERRRQERKTS